MKIKFLLLFSLFIFSNAYSQDIYESYPEGQQSYIGGDVQFYKEFHQVLVDKKLEPCANKDEAFFFRFVVYPDSTVKYLKTDDLEMQEKNKCTFELTKTVAKHLTGWNPPVVDGKKVGAIYGFWIVPSQLFQNLRPGYDPFFDMQDASYQGGINNFRKKVFQSVDLNGFNIERTFRLVVTFNIESDGKMSNVELAESSGLKTFDDMVIKSISTIRSKWTPANINGVPIRSKFKLPLAFAIQ